ncbi:spermidine hydroxycinnamoyl transferase-like [Neltuma alba]|uniref:spermidine hydroxycinnamoyl transferase-like n=1 Tax=Neltuma alba TaxID=207710 RepID=UPI0010A31655|nr:spermidine hydroxycinnamoyl transferase-like [Prosopis alba]
MVTTLSSRTVTPAAPTPSLTLPSSLCEQIKLPTHAPLLYVYKSNTPRQHLQPHHILVTSLSQALVPYYPLAGRLSWSAAGGYRWELRCNAQGAHFYQAYCHSTLDDLGDFAPAQIVQELIPDIDYSCPIEQVPLLAVQLTRFSCGGLTVGVAMCRAVIDGTAAMRFVNSWAKLARGELLGSTEMPFNDRTVLDSCKLNKTPRFDHSEFRPPPLWEGRRLEGPEHETNTAVLALKLTRDQVNKLKRKASDFASPNYKRPYSSFEVISGHVWRCVSKARYAGNDDQPTRLSTLANCRNRLKPPLPSGYAGNAAFPTVTSTCSSHDLMEKPLSFAVGNVREALERLTDEYVRSALDYIEREKEMKVARYNFHYPAKSVYEGEFRGNPNLFVVSWMNFSYREADFGWGKPVYFGPGFMDSEGKAFVLNSSDGDGVVVAICLQALHMDAFRRWFYEDIEKVFHISKL